MNMGGFCYKKKESDRTDPLSGILLISFCLPGNPAEISKNSKKGV